jgi:tetratricopeptide (TPR) repeat protein
LARAAILSVSLFVVWTLGASAQIAIAAINVPSGMTGSDILRMSQEGKHNEVALIAPEILKKNPQDIDVYIGYAWSLNALKEYQKARDIAQAGYAKFKDPRLAQALGEALYYLGENETALASLQEYLAKFPEGNKAAVTFYLCGELFVRMGKFNHADIAFSTALQYNPSNARWWARLGWVREKTSRYLPALKAYEQAVSLNPNLQDALSGKTRMLAKIKD